MKAKAARRFAEARAEADVARLLAGAGELEHVDPAEALSAALARAAAVTEALSQLVADLDLSADGLVEHPASVHYFAAVDRLAAVAGLAMRLGLPEREVRIVAEQVSILGGVIEHVMEKVIEEVRAGADADALAAMWRPAFGSALRALAAGEDETP